ncbi:membrane protein insertase YidC [Campylobacter pinnipediorum subsp. pinnipediorum]|uniref:membrane protein insertase YidC n=1 Tax=Campylobacter pinnipediorum TaxID=1965231 RepID=UPI00099500F9|nr:membrane protein insertase YidC [Campylobacter pinnipediorum]OPA77154.1 membrane protein insertase YidC [Campylobacter pinnipediorum subsp. pinnipediorum]
MDKLSTQKRVLLATIFSFVFFIAYDFFFIPKQPIQDNNISAKTNSNIEQKNNFTKKEIGNTSNEIINSKSNTSNEILVKIKSDKFEAHIDSLGRISKFYLNEDKYQTEDEKRIQLVSESLMPLEIRFSDEKVNQLAFKNKYTTDINEVNITNDSKTINLKQDLEDFTLNKKITFFQNGTYDIEVSTSKNIDYFITTGLRPSIAIDTLTVHGALLRHIDDKITVLKDDDLEGNEKFNNVDIAAASDRYYTSLFFSFGKPLNVVMSTDENKNALVFIKQNGDFKTKAYIGPKDHDVLQNIDKRLTNIIEYGWFTFIAKPMFSFLNFLHTHIGNWGWAIVVLTISIRIILFPLTYKGMVSMNKIKEIAPKMKELQAKYKGDPQKLNTHMMELYKKHNANPMGGCLPILMQIPIFFAIYRVLLNAIELKAAPWIFWIHDLSVMDPYFILPILMGATMFLQQKLTPTTFNDPMQEKIMKFLPLIFTVFFVSFPAGLTLYWFINNLFSVAQQSFVNRLFEKQKNKSAEVK